jgi:diacylglycerol kinase family enzyme
MRQRLLIIHNAQAGKRQRLLLREVCRHLEHAGATVSVEDAQTLEQDEAIARSAVEKGGFDAVVAAGGDSTIRGVACGLIGSAMPLGIVPIGTGNVLAEEIDLGRDPAVLADTLLHGPSIDIPYGRADATPFLIMAGAGFDAHVVSRLNTPWKRSVGKLAYAWPILRQIVRKPKRFEVVIDGREVSATWLVVTRVAHYGGSFVIADGQTLSDEGFRAVVVTAESRLALAGVLISIVLGRHAQRRDVQVMACRHVRWLPDGPSIAVQLDGERVEPPPSELSLSDDRLAIIVPRASPLAVSAPSSGPSR